MMENGAIIKLGKLFHTRYGGNDIDFVDQVNYQYSSGLLLIFITIIGLRQFVGSPIQCWVPQEFTKSWEQYAENLCWVKNTYRLPDSEKIPEEDMEFKSVTFISYYQWVAIVMGGQALICWIPHICWRVWSRRIPVLLHTAREATVPDRETRQKAVQCLISALEENAQNQLRYKRKSDFFSKCVSFSINPSWRVTFIFFLVRMMFLGNNIGQLYLMKHFIRTNETLFGIWIFRDLIENQQWKESGNFPRITFCTIDIRKFGQIKPASHTFQCVLPINHFVEKIYVFLWIWFFCLAILTTVNTAQWVVIICLPWQRVHFIRQYLKALKLTSNADDRECTKFVKDILGVDGIFLLQAVSNVSSDLIALDVTASMWWSYRQARLVGVEDDISRFLDHARSTSNIV